MFFELFADLLDDLAAGPADRLDRERQEQVDHHAADDQPDQHVGAGQVEEPVEVEPGGASSANSLLNAANSTSAARAAEPIA